MEMNLQLNNTGFSGGGRANTYMHVVVVEFGFWGHKTRHRRSRLAFGILNNHILGTKKKERVETIRTKNILQLAT